MEKRFISVCSGIEAASCAWEPLGWKATAFSEIEPFPAAVLAHHYPNTPNWGDMTKFKEWPDANVDVLVGGTPCQSFSVAGLRKGLDDPRGNLMLTYGAIASKYRPKWLVWENVPGVLSSSGGRDFGTFLGMLGQLGYGFAYRVLDAQYFGLAQRRRRVFVVGYLGDWRPAAAVLFERHSLSGHPAPSRQAGQKPAPTIAGCANGGGANGPGRDVDSVESLQVLWRGSGAAVSSGHGYWLDAEDRAATLRAQDSITKADTIITMSSGQANAEIRTDGGLIAPLIAETLIASDHKGPGHNRDHNFIAHALTASRSSTQCPNEDTTLVPVTHALTTQCWNTTEDGTGRGAPLVPVAYSIMPMNSGKDYKAREVDVAQPLMAGGPVGGNQGGDFIAVPVPVNIYGGNKRTDRPEGGFYVRTDEDTSKTLDAATGLNPTCSQGGTAVMQPVAFAQNTRDEVRLMGGDGGIVGALAAEPGMKQTCYIMQPVVFDTTQITSRANYSNPQPGDPCHPLAAGAHPPAIAIRTANTSANGHGISEELSHTLDQAQGQAVAHAIAWDEELNASVEQAGTLLRGGQGGRHDGVAVAISFGAQMSVPQVDFELNQTLQAKNPMAVAFDWKMGEKARSIAINEEQSPTIGSQADRYAVQKAMQVRRLTPVECERLQGFPDNYTQIPWRKKPASDCPDGPRYKALGNSMAVPVMAWIGSRIAMVDAILSK